MLLEGASGDKAAACNCGASRIWESSSNRSPISIDELSWLNTSPSSSMKSLVVLECKWSQFELNIISQNRRGIPEQNAKFYSFFGTLKYAQLTEFVCSVVTFTKSCEFNMLCCCHIIQVGHIIRLHHFNVP